MSKYRTWIDPRAAVTRNQLAKLPLRDAASHTLRWSLHLSEEEYAYLIENNPDTLGVVPDSALFKQEWARFIQHPESRPYRIGNGT